MFENPRRGRQARNFTTNVPKILVLKSSSEQIFSRKLPLGAPDLLIRYSFNVYWPRPKVRILSLRPKKSERCFSKASQNSGLISLDWLFLPLTKDTYNGSSSRLSTETIRQTLKSTSHVLILKNDVIHNVHCYFVFFGISVVILSIYRINVFSV